MGRAITFEIGSLNLGRRVKVFGRVPGHHGLPATLTGAEQKHAIVRPDGHGKDEKVEWTAVLDWTSHNPQPLKIPPPKPVLATKTVQPAAAAPYAPPAVSDTFAVYQTLGPQLDQAIADVRAAEDLVDDAIVALDQAKAAHTESIERVKRLRAQVAKSLSAVDEVLAGTSGARIPERAVSA